MRDRRREPRIAVTLDALIRFRSGKSWVCTVKDFCTGGMFVQGDPVALRVAFDQADDQSPLEIHFTARDANQVPTHHHLAGVPVRRLENGFGVHFPQGMPKDALDALRASSRHNQQAEESFSFAAAQGQSTRSGLDPAKARKIAAACAKAAGTAIGKLVDEFFSLFEDELIGCEKRASSMLERDQFLAALKSLSKVAPDIRSTLVLKVMDQLRLLEANGSVDRKESPSQPDASRPATDLKGIRLFSGLQLALVDKADFEQWLVVTETVTAIERRLEEELFILRMWMGLLQPAWKNKDSNPVLPAAIAHGLKQALLPLEWKEEVIRVAFYSFGRIAQSRLGAFYDKLIASLEKTGLFPSPQTLATVQVKRPAVPVTGNVQDNVQGNVQGNVPGNVMPEIPIDGGDFNPGAPPMIAAGLPPYATGAGSYAGPGPAMVQTPGGVARNPGGTNGHVAAMVPHLQPSATSPPAWQADGRTDRPFDVPVDSPRDTPVISAGTGGFTHELFSGIQEVNAGLERIFQLAQATEGSQAVVSGGHDAQITSVADASSILQALAGLQRAAVVHGKHPTPSDDTVKQSLVRQLALSPGAATRLPAQTESSLDMVDSLVKSVAADEVLSKPARQLIQRLELTLSKEAVRNGGLLSGDGRRAPALEILNQLEDIDASVAAPDEEHGGTGDQVSAIVNQLINDWDQNTSAFEDAVQRLDPLVERQKKAYQRNLERIVSGCEGRSKLRRARHSVLQRLVELLEGRLVPTSLLQIINPSWRNLLVNTALRHGTRSIEWQQQVQVIARVMKRLESSALGAGANDADDSADVLLRCLAEGLSTMGVQPASQQMERLRDLLNGRSDADTRERIDAGRLASMFGWGEIERWQEPMPPTGDDRERRHWLEQLGRARSIQPGTSVKFVGPDGSEQVSTLAWVDSAGDQFVFVNRRGLLDRDLQLGDLTDSLHGGNAHVLDDYDMPLLDRVSDRMVQNAHSRITLEAHRDELTTLLNRKAYERALDKLLDKARNADSSHCALLVDLDGFRMLNSAFGIDGGDRLLRRIARVLEEVLDDEEAVIARIGADEFGVVLGDVAVAEGMDTAERIVEAIRQVEFSWQGREGSVSATVAVLGVNSATESPHQMLRNLGSACQSGKALGGDRVCLYTEDDSAIQAQREVMQLASQVETLLGDGSVELNVQMIAPAEGHAGLKGHYEVLITVKDETGVPRSPVKFIEAAESHGKMGLVDRFVVSRALDWMGRHPQALKDISGLSINLSGQSVNQEDFLGFVLEAFEKSGAAPDKVCFEITETAAIGNMYRATEFMNKIKVMGCRFSLDDFGSGMSSYGYLRKLPVDYLKIDGSFVKNMVEDEGDRAVVRSINEIGHFLGKKTVAEYVHDDATRQLACEIGVDFLQGWGIEKPKPIDMLLKTSTVPAELLARSPGQNRSTRADGVQAKP